MEDNADEPSETSQESSPSSPPARPSRPPRPPPPDIKRNPSIAQHLDALQKLRPERIRWFFKEEDNKRWTPFNGRDSLSIEETFRKIKELETSSPKADPDKPLNTTMLYDFPIVKGGLYEVDVVARQCSPIYWKEKGMAVCRGTWFIGTPGSPNLWQPVSEEDADQIENSHQSLWRAMGLHVGPTQDEPDKSKLGDALGRLNLKGYYVEWKEINDVWLYWDDIKSRIIRGVGTKIGLSSGVSASPLHRGYHTDAIVKDGPCDITHLVFVIHGIGQLLHMSNIVRNAKDLRTSVSKVLEKKIPGFPEDQRIEFLPVEWRSSLKLDEGTIESITPKTVTGIRNVLNTSMMDIMYYTSPFYRYEIINGVRDEMNRIYDAFCSRNPSFIENRCKVSIIAHSLGSVITYDILSLWDVELRHASEDELGRTGFLTESFTFLRNLAGTSEEESNNFNEDAKKKAKLTKPKENIRVELSKARNTVMELEAMLKTELEFEKAIETATGEFCPYALKFKVENLFCIGSPLPVFLTLRGIRPQDDVEDHVFPKAVCKKMFNIYHPADPVAYRLEPLISEDYTSIPPIQLHRFDHAKSGYAEEKKIPSEKSGWSLFNYRVGYNKHKENKEEDMSRSNSISDDSESQEDELVIVDHAAAIEQEKQEKPEKQEKQEQMKAAASKEKGVNEKKSGWMSSWFGSPRKTAKSTEDVHEAARTEADGAAAPDDSPKKIKGEHVVVPGRVLNDRLDYVLREGYMENNYISAVTSHIAYWGSCDVARFVLEKTLILSTSEKNK
ncbi:phospholipase DDHD1-like [Actinia tenebrosa]|uniref:Phospholipase DDHD1-like n=1 Tax=Actinia tenebrosa TaxID=6105 RepID=A0A6P8I2M8_ACTTE|nr:phospholipase DDHD1-like [Actinia tenebrosa]